MSGREYSYTSSAETLISFIKNLVIKNETRVKEYETQESLDNARKFLAAYEQTDTFNQHTKWTKMELIQAGIEEELIEKILEGSEEIPDNFKNKLLQIRRNIILNSYEEKNNYYRMLNGLPNYGEDDIMTSFGKTVTQLNSVELFRLEQEELGLLKQKYPKAEYLNHLGERKIPIYTARKANAFDVLYYQHYILEESQALKFIEFYYQCRHYVLTVNYSKAFTDMYYYDSFISLFVVFMATQRFINEYYNYAIRKEFFTMEDIKNTFLSYGLPFFSEIPLKYQRNIVKNLNNLIKYKGTDKVLVDIVKLFGFSNIELYRYFLVKDFKRDSNGDPVINPNDLSLTYEVKFAQVPFESTDITQALQTTNLYQAYEEVIEGDPYWGIYEEDAPTELLDESFKEEILNMQFNYLNTKYISMNTIFDISKNSMELCYFFNLLNTMNVSDGLGNMTFISKDIKPSANSILLFNAITAVYYLLCKKFGFEDNILKSSTAAASVYAFEFNKDTEKLLENIEKRAKINILDHDVNFNIKKLKNDDINDMYLNENIMYTRDELLDLYFRNSEYRDFLIERMNATEDYLEYKALTEIYNYNMLSEAVTNSYGNYNTYTDYLKDNDLELYEYVLSNSQNNDAINLTINNLLYAIETYINSSKFDDMFSSLSSLSNDIIKTYVTKMINIFKAYTIELKKVNIYYVFDEKLLNTIRMFSVVYKHIVIKLGDGLLDDYLDVIKLLSNINKKDIFDTKDDYLITVLHRFNECLIEKLLKEVKMKFNVDMVLYGHIDLFNTFELQE